jgi:hypothetical protein
MDGVDLFNSKLIRRKTREVHSSGWSFARNSPIIDDRRVFVIPRIAERRRAKHKAHACDNYLSPDVNRNTIPKVMVRIYR